MFTHTCSLTLLVRLVQSDLLLFHGFVEFVEFKFFGSDCSIKSWDLLCGIHSVGFTMWDSLCGIYYVGFTMWDSLCGINYVGLIMLDSLCGIHYVGFTMWDLVAGILCFQSLQETSSNLEDGQMYSSGARFTKKQFQARQTVSHSPAEHCYCCLFLLLCSFVAV